MKAQEEFFESYQSRVARPIFVYCMFHAFKLMLLLGTANSLDKKDINSLLAAPWCGLAC